MTPMTNFFSIFAKKEARQLMRIETSSASGRAARNHVRKRLPLRRAKPQSRKAALYRSPQLPRSTVSCSWDCSSSAECTNQQ
jgi:hypothetical protein